MKKFLLVTTALWLSMGAPAEAAPLVAAVGGLVASITGSTIGSLVVGIALKLGVSYLMNALFGPDEPEDKGSKMEMENGADKPPRIVLGYYGTAGHLLYHNSYGDDRDYYVQVIILSAKRIKAISNYVDINGQRCVFDWATVDSDGFSITDEYHKKGKDYCRAKVHLGGQTVADPFLTDTFGSDPDWAWANDMIVKGCAYAIVEGRYSNDGVWTGQPSFGWSVQGMPLYDPRRDSTVGGSGTHRWNNESTWGGPGDDNPKVQIYNIVRGIRDVDGTHLWGGRVGDDAYRMPLDYWFAAMNVCDEDIEKKDGTHINRFTSGIEISLDEQPLEVIKDIDRACSGYTTEFGGTYKTWCGAPGLSVMTITDDDFMITERATDDLFSPINETYNSAVSTYPEPRSGWAMEPGPTYVDADYLAADGGEPLQADLKLRCVTEQNQVQRIQRAAIKDSRAMLRHQGVLPPECMLLEPHDPISLISQRNGYHGDGVAFLIGSKVHRPNVFQEVAIRSINPNAHYWVKELELDHTVGRLGVIRRGALDLGFAISAGQIDSASGRDKPAIDVAWTWSGIDIDVDRVLWRVRRAGTTKIIKDGTIHRLLNGDYQISGNFLRFGKSYEVQFEPVPISRRDRVATAWMSVTCVAADVPAPPALTRVSKLADDGALNFYIDAACIPVTGEASYRFRTVSDGVTLTYDVAGPKVRIPVTSGDAYVVDVAAVIDGQVGVYSSTADLTVTRKNTNNDPATGLTATINRHGKIILRATRSTAMKDFKRFNIYGAASNDFALASFIDDTASSRFEHGDLGNGVDRWYWVTTVDQSNNESPKYPGGNATNTAGIKGSTVRLAADDLGDGIVSDAKTIQTPPAAPSITVTPAGGDFDGNGTVEAGLTFTITHPSSAGVPTGPYSRKYIVFLQRSTTLAGAYADFPKNRITIDAEDVADTLTTIEARGFNSKYYYKAAVKGVSFSGKRSALSGYTSTGQKPSSSTSFTGQKASGAAVVPIGNAFRISWTLTNNTGGALDSTIYKETEILVNGVPLTRTNGLSYTDDTARTVNTAYSITLKHYDKNDGVTTVSDGVSATYRAANSSEIGVASVPSTALVPDAVIPSKFYARNFDNFARDPDCVDIAAWSNPELLTRYFNTNAWAGPASRYFLRKYSSGPAIAIMTGADMRVAGNKWYQISAYVGPSGFAGGAGGGAKFTNRLHVAWGKYDTIDSYVNISEVVLDTITNATGITLVSGTIQAPADAQVMYVWGSVERTALTGEFWMDFGSLQVYERLPASRLNDGVAVNRVIGTGAVSTDKIAASAVMQKYQAFSNSALTITTANQNAQSDTITWGSDFEWVETEFSFYVGANASSIALTFEVLQGSTSLFTFQPVKPVNDMVFLKRAFGPGSFTGTSGTINIRATTGSGTLNISDRQLITKVYKR